MEAQMATMMKLRGNIIKLEQAYRRKKENY